MKTWFLLPLLFLSIPAHAAKWNCSGIVKFTDSETGDTGYQILRLTAEPKDSSTYSTTILFGVNPAATGSIFLESPTRFEANGPILTGGTQHLEGTIDFQIQGAQLFGDVTFSVTVMSESGSLISKTDGHTYQQCDRAR